MTRTPDGTTRYDERCPTCGCDGPTSTFCICDDHEHGTPNRRSGPPRPRLTTTRDELTALAALLREGIHAEPPRDPVDRARAALSLLRAARDLLHEHPRTRARVALAITSAGGAVRVAETRAFEAARAARADR